MGVGARGAHDIGLFYKWELVGKWQKAHGYAMELVPIEVLHGNVTAAMLDGKNKIVLPKKSCI